MILVPLKLDFLTWKFAFIVLFMRKTIFHEVYNQTKVIAYDLLYNGITFCSIVLP